MGSYCGYITCSEPLPIVSEIDDKILYIINENHDIYSEKPIPLNKISENSQKSPKSFKKHDFFFESPKSLKMSPNSLISLEKVPKSLTFIMPIILENADKSENSYISSREKIEKLDENLLRNIMKIMQKSEKFQKEKNAKFRSNSCESSNSNGEIEKLSENQMIIENFGKELEKDDKNPEKTETFISRIRESTTIITKNNGTLLNEYSVLPTITDNKKNLTAGIASELSISFPKSAVLPRKSLLKCKSIGRKEGKMAKKKKVKFKDAKKNRKRVFTKEKRGF